MLEKFEEKSTVWKKYAMNIIIRTFSKVKKLN